MSTAWATSIMLFSTKVFQLVALYVCVCSLPPRLSHHVSDCILIRIYSSPISEKFKMCQLEAHLVFGCEKANIFETFCSIRDGSWVDWSEPPELEDSL